MGTGNHILFIGDHDDYFYLRNAISELDPVLSVEYRAAFNLMDFFTGMGTKSSPLPRLILMEVDVPGINETEIAGHIKSLKKLKDTPVLFLSSYPQNWDIRFWEKRGITILAKPRGNHEFKTIAETIVYSMI